MRCLIGAPLALSAFVAAATAFTVREKLPDQMPTNCAVTFQEGRDCSSYTYADMSKPVSTWDYLTAVCKLKNPDFCLWQGCLANGNLTQGARYYLDQHGTDSGEAEYCEKMHCHNTEFNLETTTVQDAEAYCDKKFGDEWRNLQTGYISQNGLIVFGYGGAGHEPGSGIWECAHGNFQCDWAYCQIGYCGNEKNGFQKPGYLTSLLQSPAETKKRSLLQKGAQRSPLEAK